MNIQPKMRRGDLRQALLDYAMEEAIAGDIETMSLRKAARDLGVSSGAVYRHFADKDSLLAEIVVMGFFEMRDKYCAIRPADSPAQSPKQVVDRARDLVSYYIRFAIKKPAQWRMMFGRVGVCCREKMMAERPEELAYSSLDVVKENLTDLYRLGAIDHEPSMEDVRYIWSAVHGAADLAQSGIRFDHEHIDQIVEDTVKRNFLSVGFDMSKV